MSETTTERDRDEQEERLVTLMYLYDTVRRYLLDLQGTEFVISDAEHAQHQAWAAEPVIARS